MLAGLLAESITTVLQTNHPDAYADVQHLLSMLQARERLFALVVLACDLAELPALSPDE
jgi:hypothetical protein